MFQNEPLLYREALLYLLNFLNVGLSPSQKNYFIFFNIHPLKMTKNTFYFILKSLFVLKIITF